MRKTKASKRSKASLEQVQVARESAKQVLRETGASLRASEILAHPSFAAAEHLNLSPSALGQILKHMVKDKEVSYRKLHWSLGKAAKPNGNGSEGNESSESTTTEYVPLSAVPLAEKRKYLRRKPAAVTHAAVPAPAAPAAAPERVQLALELVRVVTALVRE